MPLCYVSAGPPLHLGLFTSQAAFDRALKKLDIKERVPYVSDGAAGTTHRFEQEGGPPVFLVGLSAEYIAEADGIEIAGLLTHESVHCYQGLVDWMGEEQPGVEHQAYGIEAAARTLMTMFLETPEGRARLGVTTTKDTT